MKTFTITLLMIIGLIISSCDRRVPVTEWCGLGYSWDRDYC